MCDIPGRGRSRLVAMHGSTTTWGSHLDLALLPDYLVYSKDRVLEWGFWGNHWQFQERT